MHDHEDAASAMLLAALAERASTFTDAGAQLRAGVFEDRDGTEKQTCEDGDRRGEEQDRSIDADIMNAREPIGGENDKRAQCAPGEAQSKQTAEQTESEAFEP